MLDIKNLHKAYKKNKVLKGIDLDLDRPGIIAVLGPNGCGKTTLIKCILGMVIPQQGEISFMGRSVERKWTYRQHINYLPQIARFPENLTVKEMLKLVKSLRPGKAQDLELIEIFGLEPFLDKRLGELSGGTRQKVNLVQAFCYDSPLLILDEPTAGLDPVALIHLKDLLRKERMNGKTILITTHIMSFVEEMADQVIFLLDGHIHYDGSLKGLIAQYGEKRLEYAIAKILQGEQPPSQNGKLKKAESIQLTNLKQGHEQDL